MIGSVANMGRKSLKTEKNIYQIARENAGFTRREASEKLGFLSENRIEKIEADKAQIHPAEVLAMEKAYQDELLVNRHCSSQCAIGRKYIPLAQKRPISEVVLEIVALTSALEQIQPDLIQAALNLNKTGMHLHADAIDQSIAILSDLAKCRMELSLYQRDQTEK